ncbi:YncE family protein [Citrobacter portucalensis]|uniref:YncE family protein n=1 Tax=Citrobacter portucalensis TaxID=1639133 RepID=UPI0015EA350C|nr:YncE family protein [Citrobacter portucalensis]MBA8418721.1 YncE family protein [Citrobacter freundii]MDE9612005.1 YncE family protein [Citrobacter portucalensis]QMM96186.1 YncE family protein [Citrobacter freundii]WFZ23196.1 YncE family protein [Citrobacter portucalensis]
MKKTTSALALLIAAALSGCAAHTTPASNASITEKTAQPAVSDVQQRALADGLYEMALSPAGDALYVASAEGFKDVQGGVVYKLDPKTLKTFGLSHTDMKNFGMAISPDGKTVYVTNSLDGGLSALNTADGKVKNRVLFPERNPEGFPYGARQVLLHNGLLYIGAVADPAVIWVVDAETLKLKTRIKNTGKWMTGLHYSDLTQRIYAANGGGEILVINPRNQRVEKRWKPLGEQPALLLNMAEDAQTGRLFVTDNSKAKTTLVLDIHTGKLLKKLDVGDSLAVKFNAKRNEIYITQRDSGKLLSLNATDYSVKKSWDLPPNPNSLLLSADGQTLFVTVKQKFNKDHSTSAPDNVVRIDLNK